MLTLTASWVVPVARPPLREGRVAVREGRVVWVGRAGDPGEPTGRLVDLGSGVLLPGLVNAHVHLELSHLKGRIDSSGGFVPWVSRLVDRPRAEPAAEMREGVLRALRELRETGTVAVADVSNRLAHLDLLDRDAVAAVVFLELIGWDPAQAGAVMERAEALLAGAPKGVAVRLAAHAPHSVSAALFRLLAERGGPAALHLAESPAEADFLRDGRGEWAEFLAARGLGRVPFAGNGLGPVAYVDSLGALHGRLLAAHCVQVDAPEVAILASRGVHVALCPRSNRNLDVGAAPLPALVEAGVRLCLGTDSLASVESLDLLEEASLLHRQFPDLDPALLVRAMTAGGAAALGLSELGSIEPGRRAALAFAEAEPGLRDPLAFLVSGEARARRLDP